MSRHKMNPGLQVISESKEAEVDGRIWKIILLAFFGILTSVVSIAGFNRIFSGWNPVFIWPTVAAFALFLIFTVLQVFFIKSRWKFFFIAFFESFAPLALFQDKIYPQPDWILVAGAALAFLFLFSAMNRGRRLLADSIRINFFTTSRMFLSRAALGFFLLFTALVYLNYFSWNSFDVSLGKVIVSGALASSEPIAKIIAPGISLDGTAEEFFSALATSQLRDSSQKFMNSAGQGTEAQFQYLPPRDREKVVGLLSAQLEKAFRDRFGNFNPDDKVSDIAFAIIASYAGKLNASSPWLIPVSACVLFFLFIKGVFALLYWLIAFIAFIVFKALIAFGFAHISSEERSREFALL